MGLIEVNQNIVNYKSDLYGQIDNLLPNCDQEDVSKQGHREDFVHRLSNAAFDTEELGV